MTRASCQCPPEVGDKRKATTHIVDFETFDPRLALDSTLPAGSHLPLGCRSSFQIIGLSDLTGAGRGTRKVRLLDYWWPRSMNDIAIRKVHSGLVIDALRPEFAESIRKLLVTVGTNHRDRRNTLSNQGPK